MQKWLPAWIVTISAVAFGYQSGSGEAASIDGRVVVQGTGSPLKNAIVALKRIPDSPRQRAARPILRQTGEDGRFLFANVAAGEYELSAEKRGFVAAKYAARKSDPQTGRILVKGDHQLGDLVLRLAAQAVIAGRVFDDENEPVEGARVALLKLDYSNGAPRWSEVASAMTLDNGEYRISKVTAGRYLVRCGITKVERAPSISEIATTYAPTYYPNVSEPYLATVIAVRGDGAAVNGIDIRITAVPVLHVRGTFMPPSARRYGQAVVLLERSDPSKVFATSSTEPPDYLFDFPGIPPGSYLVFAWSMDGKHRAVQPVEVKEQDVENVVLSGDADRIPGSIKLKPGGRNVDLHTVSLQIQPKGVEGKITYRGFGEPIDIADDLKFQFPLRNPMFAIAGISISKLPEGCYVASIEYGGKRVPGFEIEYSDGAALEITIGSDGARVDGKTLDENDNPRERAVVALIPVDGKGAPRSVQSGPGGTFQITGVPPGEYKMLAWDDAGQDDIADPDFVNRFDSQATRLKLDPNGAVSASIRVIAPDTVQ